MNIQNSRDYYGKILEDAADLGTGACCFGDFSKHYGVFPGCGSDSPFASITINQAAETASCC